MPNLNVKTKFTDERSVTLPTKGDQELVREIGLFFQSATREGYRLKYITAHTSEVGTQRDPETRLDGVTITLERDPNSKPPVVMR